MRKIISYIPCVMFLITNTVLSQNIFNEEYEGCTTSRFVVESDTTTAKIKDVDILKVLAINWDDEVVKEIRGILSLQILINMEGSSCLLSVENQTNIETEKLNLKTIIDNNLVWYKPREVISSILAIKFYGDEVELKRIGLNKEKGFHELRSLN